jgi:hypothetical protein
MKQVKRKRPTARREIDPRALGIQIGQPCVRCGVSIQAFTLVFANLCAACAVEHLDRLLGNPPESRPARASQPEGEN